MKKKYGKVCGELILIFLIKQSNCQNILSDPISIYVNQYAITKLQVIRNWTGEAYVM